MQAATGYNQLGLIEDCEVAEGIARENDQIGVKACRELTGSP